MGKLAWLISVLVGAGLTAQFWAGSGVGSETRSVSSVQSIHDVVYFQGTPSTGILNPMTLSQELGSISVSTWSAVVSHDQSSEIDALIIDSGSLSSVNWAWVSTRLSRGLITVGLNVPLTSIVPQLANAELTAEHAGWLSRGSYPANHNAEYYSIALAPVFGAPAARTAVAQDPNYEATETDCLTNLWYVNEDSTVTPRSGMPRYVFTNIRRHLDENHQLEVAPCE